jgi:Uma2 family endonuclease
LGRVSFAPYAMLLQSGGPHREPDVMFVRTEHLNRWTTQRLHGAADFVVEVLSKDTAGEDRGRKRDDYERLGVSEYLIPDARPSPSEFAFLRLNEVGRYESVTPDEQGHYHSMVLPGFWFDPRWFAQGPLPEVEDLLLLIAPEAYEAHLLAKIRARHEAGDRQ